MSAWQILRTSDRINAADFTTGRGPEAFPAGEEDGAFAHLFVDTDSPVNTLTTPVLEELRDLVVVLEKMNGVKALFLWSAKEKHFIAGAHIDEIAEINFPETGAAKAAEGQKLFERIASLPYPSFAVIRGTCLGGGLELALALDYRIAVDDPATRIGLPEIRLGIIPGFGGCVRLPRLIGLRRGLAHILAGSRLPARAALGKGMVDAMVPPEGYQATAVFAAAKILADGGAAVQKRRRSRSGGLGNLILEKNPLGRALIARAARKQVQKKTGGHYPAAPAAVDVVVKGFGLPFLKGLELESHQVGELIASDVSKNLISIFCDSERARRLDLSGDADLDAPEHPFVGVLGAGVMGAGIAELFLSRGSEVRLRDLDGEALRRGLASVGSALEKSVKKRRISERERDETLSRLTHTSDAVGFSRCDTVIEAIVERLDVKRAAIAELEPQLRDDAIVATNTSSLSVTAIQEGAAHPERIVGLHFFNPVARMPLVEVIPGEHTAPHVVARAVSLAQTVGKYPVVVQDSPGFLVNRLLMPYLDSACRLLERGLAGCEVDAAALAFGLPMGPFRLLDEVGIDIGVEVCGILHEAFGDRARPAGILATLLEKEWPGRKGGVGFYRYGDDPRDRPTWNDGVADVVDAGGSQTADAGEIVHYLVDRLVDEAARCLEEKIIDAPSTVDLAMVMGTGFPPFLGGPLRHADRQGLVALVGRLKERAENGEPCQPCPLLEQLASGGSGFYSLEPTGTEVGQKQMTS